MCLQNCNMSCLKGHQGASEETRQRAAAAAARVGRHAYRYNCPVLCAHRACCPFFVRSLADGRLFFCSRTEMARAAQPQTCGI